MRQLATNPEPDPTHLQAFLRDAICASIDPREVRRLGDAILKQISDAALPFVSKLPPGEVVVRVLNPDGVRSGRTVIEVLCLDQPFLVDTVRLTLERLGLRERSLFHPLLAVERDPDGNIVRMGREDVDQRRESYIYAEIARVETERLSEIECSVEYAVHAARNVVTDHPAMIERALQHTDHIRHARSSLEGDPSRIRNLVGFLGWLLDDSFVFLGYRRYCVSGERGSWCVALDPYSSLGMMRDLGASRFDEVREGEAVPELVRSRLDDERLIFFDKSRNESTVHRHGRLDSISVKELDSSGRVVGFGRFIGLLTNKALRQRPSSIPILERRCAQVLDALASEPGTHRYKAAVAAFDSLPVEFLFQFDLAHVTAAVERVVASEELRKLEVCVARDPLNRSFFVSAILPRRLYEEDLRESLLELLVESYGATYVDHRTSFLDDEIALIHFFCTSASDVDPETLGSLERDIQRRVARWQDAFESVLLERHDEIEAYRLTEDYAPALPDRYRVATPPSEAVLDVECLQRLRYGDSGIELRFDESPPGGVDLKVYVAERPYLTDLLPVLDHFGFRVIDASATEVLGPADLGLWIVSFQIEPISEPGACPHLDDRLLDGLRAVLSSRVEDDVFSRLILEVGLDWRAVDLLRTYIAYWMQLGGAPTRAFAADALLLHPDATRALVELFQSRFDPDLVDDRSDAQAEATLALGRARAPIESAAIDRVFATLQNLIEATTRTSFFTRPSDPERHEMALKFDSPRVKVMPEPRPFAEIFVHSAQMAGVHLRAGRVARGGIRWSDRPLDLRSEVLGLLKAQRVKNGLIVPLGSKGGFVLKRHFADPREGRAEADCQYTRFISALLSITDNSVDDRIVRPPRVVCYDAEDPYLVVAADKGTAHLPDAANQVARDAGFWLGDAFASGGSNGYDHKAEGITARGAWVCVRRHFLEMGIDIDREPFGVVGIGDMSGDVFGNGLLLARRGRLIAAFNHLHVFLDPDPEPERAWQERRRLFELAGSTWRDYDPELISEGGGVFDRGAKSIALSPRVRELLGMSEAQLSGEELIRAILRMPVDLLWNGGIGTYVKASSESGSDVPDRANASVRIDAPQLGARVVGEGGNLGLTQLARVEYALGGGRINTDALDNSGGVDLSDHEVNFKLLLERSRRSGRADTEECNRLLRDCVDDACAAVLDDNASQSRCVSMDQVRSWEDPERMMLACEFLSQTVGLDPELEFLPDRDTIRARATQSGARRGYTRPELAVLLGYTKGMAKRALIASHVPDHPGLETLYGSYFAADLRQRFGPEIAEHPLRREITATCLTNHVIDCAGVTFVPEMVQGLSVEPGDVIAAYYTADLIVGAGELREQIESLADAEPLRLRARLRVEEGVRLAAGVCLALQRSSLLEPDELCRWREGFRRLHLLAPEWLDPSEADGIERRAQALVERGLDAALARQIELLLACARSLGALQLALSNGADLRRTAGLHAAVGQASRIDWLLAQLEESDRSDGWRRVATETLYLEMLQAQRDLTGRALNCAGELSVEQALARAGLASHLRQIDGIVAQIQAEGPELGPLIVLSQQIRRLC